VAIAFVFELDDQLYQRAVPKRRREIFESSPARPSSPLVKRASGHAQKAGAIAGRLGSWRSRWQDGRLLVADWSSFSVLVDMAFSTVFYGLFINNRLRSWMSLSPSNFFIVPRVFVYARAVLFVVAQLHITRVCGCAQMPAREFVARGLLFAVLALFFAAFGFHYILPWLDAYMGLLVTPLFAFPDTAACLQGVEGDDVDCGSIHVGEGVFATISSLGDQYMGTVEERLNSYAGHTAQIRGGG